MGEGPVMEKRTKTRPNLPSDLLREPSQVAGPPYDRQVQINSNGKTGRL